MFDFAYIKNGDVRTDLARIDAASDLELHSGSGAFLFDFLGAAKDRSILLISAGEIDGKMQYRPSVQVLTFKLGSTGATRLFARPVLFIRVLNALIRARPQRLLCGSNRERLWASFIYARFAGIPLVHSRHGSFPQEAGSFVRSLTDALDYACIRRIVGVICHGPYLKQQLKELGVPESRIQEFDVGLGAFRTNAESAGSSARLPTEGEITVLYTGRIERHKGVFDLLDALDHRMHGDAKLSLWYAGQGSASEELARTIASRGLDRQVKLIGRMPHRELAGIMARCKAVVTPTRSKFGEGRCMVAMESLALGVPVVAPNFGPFPLLIEHGKNGLLFEPDCVDDLAEKMAVLLDNDSLYAALRAGAKRSGDALLVPPLSFGQAVMRAFKITA